MPHIRWLPLLTLVSSVTAAEAEQVHGNEQTDYEYVEPILRKKSHKPSLCLAPRGADRALIHLSVELQRYTMHLAFHGETVTRLVEVVVPRVTCKSIRIGPANRARTPGPSPA